jgi:beta-propeller repeat-containing protein
LVNQTASGIVPAASSPVSEKLLSAYAKLPLSLEINRGQAGRDIQFLSRGRNLSLFLGSGDATFLINKRTSQTAEPESRLHEALEEGALLSDLLSAPSAKLAAKQTQQLAATATQIVRMSLLGARSGLQGVGIGNLTGKINYFIGDDPAKWRTNLETFTKIKYENVYPGIDLVYYGNQQQLEYDFVVAPGANPKQIGFALQGVEHIRVDASSGDLVLDIEDSELHFARPNVYQIEEEQTSGLGGRKRLVGGDYMLEADNHVAFNLAPYDSSKPLVIDPVIRFYTYLGGMLPDVALHVAADGSGVYVIGATASPDFPTASAISSGLHAAICGTSKAFPCPDAFVTKVKPDGSGILYSTYLGGTASDLGIGIAVDPSQQVYLVGETESLDFPTTTSGFQKTATTKMTRAFLTKLSSSGSQILYSTFFGGTPGSRLPMSDHYNDTFATAIAVDNTGNAYLSGYTRSNSLPTTAGVVQPSAGGNVGQGGVQCHSITGMVVPCSDGFVAKFNTLASGTSSLVYATYLGGSYYDAATGVSIDSNGEAYVTGATLSDDFPIAAAFQATRKTARCGPFVSGSYGGHVCASAFISKLNPTASAFVFSSYLGGTGDTAAMGIALDSSGAAYLTGITNASDFPATQGVVQPSLASANCSYAGRSIVCPDAFVAKVNSSGLLSYATFLGGTGADAGLGLTVDSAGHAYVVGITLSTNFPTASPLQSQLTSGACTLSISGTPVNLNCPDAFLTEIDPAGATLPFSTYLGGTNVDFATSVVLDAANNIYVAGGTLSPGLATTGAFQTMLGSKGDAFVLSIPSTAPSFTMSAAAGGSTSATVKAGQTATYNLQITPAGGFTGAVNLGCAGAPSLATCSSTSPVSVTGTSAVPFTVTVTTTAPSALLPISWRIPGMRVFAWSLAAIMILLILLATKRSVGLSRRAPLWGAAIIIGFSMLIGCGGGGGGNGGKPGTPTGTYTLTLTGTSGSITQNLSLTLTVQ